MTNNVPQHTEIPLDLDKKDVLSYTLGNIYTSDQIYSNASILAHDLNDLLEVQIDDLPDQPFDLAIDNSADQLVLDLLDDDSIRNWILAFDLLNDHKNYARLFYEKYSLWLMPLSPVSGPKNFFNKSIIHQAQRFPFLLHVVLAMTASFEYKEYGDIRDEENRKYYTGLALKELNSVFDEYGSADKVIGVIEPLILTSLIFVTGTAWAVNGAWRNHLRGANNLFKQYLTLQRTSTPIILLAATWFSSFEIIAVMTNPGGGSINNEELLEHIMLPILYKNDWNLAIQMGLVLPNGYNVFLGQSSVNVYLFIRFMKLTIKIRKSETKVVDSDDLVELMTLVDQAMKFSLASEDGLIDSSSPYYPKTNGMTFLPPETYGYKDDLVFSWFDLSDKIHLRSLYLKILTNEMYYGMPVESKVVQDVVHKILNMCYFFTGIDFSSGDLDFDAIIKENPVLNDRRLLMLHSSMLNCGLCCVDTIDRYKIQLYFKSLMNLGTTTVQTSYNKILAYWRGSTEVFDYVPYL